MAIDNGTSEPDGLADAKIMLLRIRAGYTPNRGDMSKLPPAGLDYLVAHTAPTAAPSEPRFTPDVLARWVGQVAPLAEAEKVLKEWLARMGGIVYSDIQGGTGIYTLDNRPGRMGLPIETAPEYFDTMSQFLTFALDFAKHHIARTAIEEYIAAGGLTAPPAIPLNE